jgi:hypothetical protein
MRKGSRLSQMADFDTKATHVYTLCGLQVRSDIPLTSVPTSARGGESVDILIQIACGHSPIASNAGQTVFEHSAGLSLIRIEDVVDFEIRGGRQIRVWPATGAAQKDVELFLFGPAWATLCHQRGLLPLHASAIVTRSSITAFAGHSRAGKSTTAALMSSLDYELLADDILPVNFDQNSVPGAWPYLRRLKLSGDSTTHLQLTPTEPVSETRDKERYFVRPACVADDKWRRLERIYLLEIDSTDSGVSIERITGQEAVRALIDQTYHFQFIIGTGRFRNHLTFCTQLASKIAVYRLRRSPSFGVGKEFGSIICEHLEGAPT